MGHLDINALDYVLPDGRPLLGGVTFRVGEGAKTALIGPNGTGKTTVLRLIAGDLDAHGGAVTRSGELGVMPQFIGRVGHDGTDATVRDLLLSVAPAPVRAAAQAVDAAELAMMERDDEPTQVRYAQALADWAEVGGYDHETHWDVCTVAALHTPFEKAQWRDADTLSGGEQKRLVLESLLRGPQEVLLLDEPDNYLDVPAKRWLEDQLVASPKTVLLVSHDRELLDRVVTRVATLEPTAAGATAWIHPGPFRTYHQARVDRLARLDEQRKRWDEEHAKLIDLVRRYKAKSAYNSDMAGRYRAAQTRLAKFEEIGPPEALPREQRVTMRLTGGRTAKRSVICEGLELFVGEGPHTGTAEADVRPFELEVWYGERVAVLGPNGSGKSHFLALLASGGTDPGPEHRLVGDMRPAPVRARGVARLGSRVRPGWFAQTHRHTAFDGRTLLQILHRGDDDREGMPRELASRALDRYELARCAEQTFASLSGGQQARFQILLLELAGATLLLLDEPTDNLDLQSAEALEEGLARFRGTVLAVTHDRWFAREFDRFVVFGADGRVHESPDPIWQA